jgi:hypothetical protein
MSEINDGLQAKLKSILIEFEDLAELALKGTQLNDILLQSQALHKTVNDISDQSITDDFDGAENDYLQITLSGGLVRTVHSVRPFDVEVIDYDVEQDESSYDAVDREGQKVMLYDATVMIHDSIHITKKDK